MDGKSSLNTKYDGMFRQVVRHYENKQFKKGLNVAEEILAANKDHGETLALKGLLLKSLDRSEEGYACVKEGIKHAITSHICWHIYGTMYIKDQDYAQAAKCYLSALRFSPGNQQILRDLSPVQLQLRDYKGLLDTREKLLGLKPNIRNYWLGFAIAQYLNKNYDKAVKVIDAYIDTGDKETLDNKNEYSELLLFKAYILKAAGEWDKLNKFLNDVKSKIVDTISWLEYKGAALLKLKKGEEAANTYHKLLEMNCENHEYLSGYQMSKGFNGNVHQLEKPTQSEGLLALYDKLEKDFPHSASVQRLALNFATGEQFKTRLATFVKNYVKKTIPSLFSALKALYSVPEKMKIIEELFLSYVPTLQGSNKFPDEEEVQSPSALLWVLLYLAQHYDLLNDTEKAVEYINKAIEHTPTLVELYVVQGRIYKHAGNPQKASECLEFARKLDLADRYLNSKSAKFLLRAGKFEEAEQVISLFAKHSTETNQLHNMHEMQCMWFENEAGKCLFKQQQYGRALKQFDYTRKHFDEMYEDQYDFHNYCLRKMVLRSYVDMLNYQDTIRNHKYFFKAAVGLVSSYIFLADNPPAKPEKKEQKEEEDEFEIKKRKKKEEELSGASLLYVEDYLEEASKPLKQLEQFCADKLETHLLAVEVYLRKQKYLLALKAATKARQLAPQHASTHKAVAKVFHALEKGAVSDELVKEILNQHKAELVGENKTLEQYNQEYLAKNSNNIAAVASYAYVATLINESAKAQAVELITKFKPDSEKQKLQDYILAGEIVSSTFKEAESQFKELAKAQFPLSSIFS